MTTPSKDILKQAWHFPTIHEDPDRDLENRLESVRDAVAETAGDWSGYWSQCRLAQVKETL